MNIYEVPAMTSRLAGKTYVGRGIVIGKSEDGKNAVSAYFIMGRSQNSRNRVFKKHGEALFTEPFDASLVDDPSLILYAAVRSFENKLVVTNGNQTDTIVEHLEKGEDFIAACRTREFEPDGPNFTPRISGQITFDENDFSYQMSILKSSDAQGSACTRFFYEYPSLPGVGHFLHTYVDDGNPIPTFQGEPERVKIPNSMDAFAEEIWNGLDENNKISLYVRYTELASGKVQEKIINKNA